MGCGPAGAAAALTLSRLGATVCVVDRFRRRPLLGEGLPPAATPVLQRLGLWEAFSRGDHRPSYGNRSSWGRAEIADLDFIRSPHGQGWHLDRASFDRLLREGVKRAGARLLNGTVVDSQVDGSGPATLTISTGTGRLTVRAGTVIDAGGRSTSRIRPGHIPRLIFDDLIGLIGVMRADYGDSRREHTTLVEAVPGGWWYVAPLPDGRLVIGHMLDRDGTGRHLRSRAGWLEALQAARHVRDLRDEYDLRLVAGPSVVSARSSRLPVAAGTGWFAAGDAAASFDPLSALGIRSALESGIQAARAIGEGTEEARERYAEYVRATYAGYLATLLGYYAAEQRWPGEPFWARRHAALRSLLA